MVPVTIILPVYNGIKYLKASVSSVLSQQFKNFEFLIIDDCSTDESWDYLQSLADDRLQLFRNEKNEGLFFNLNFLINRSNGRLIKLWSQDDIMQEDCLSEIVAFHNRYPQIGFSYTDRFFIDAKNEFLNIGKADSTPELISTELHAEIAFITGSIAGNIANVTITKAALDKVGLFNEQMKISGDFEMWVRLAKDHPVGFLKLRLIQLRIHKDQLSSQEQYFIYHLKEDIAAYQLLFGYISAAQQKQGWNSLRNTKLIFYYTLMLKAFLKGKLSTGCQYLIILHSFANMYTLTWHYLKIKVFAIGKHNGN